MPARKDAPETVEVVVIVPSGVHHGSPEFPEFSPAGAKVALPRELAQRLLDQGHAVELPAAA